VRPDAGTLAGLFSEAGVEAVVEEERFGIVCRLDPASLDAGLAAAAGAGYDFLVDLFASDTGEQLEVTYHLRSIAGDTEFYVRVPVPYDGEVPSAWGTYPAALYAEREAAELFGMSFSGHPNPKKLLTADDVDEYFMRKDVPVRTHEEVLRHE
jgi:NADH:ubiquinone oxidoreductase subunit C